MARTTTFLTMLAIALLTTSLSPAGDALLDAKRDAAAKLLKDGKTADAQKLYEEIIAEDDTQWSDHYALGKLYDKAGKTSDAVAAYQRTSKLLKNRARTQAERGALSESEKRLKNLDEVTAKLEVAAAEFYARLTQLAKEAERAKNAEALEQITELQDAIILSTNVGRRLAVTVNANAGWIDTGLDVETGWELLLNANGEWSAQGTNAAYRCNADGRASAGLHNGLPVGALVGKVGESGSAFMVGTRVRLMVKNPGRLFLACNDAGPQDNQGSLDVTVIRR